MKSCFYDKTYIWDFIVVGLIAQVWLVLHSFEAIYFKISKKEKFEPVFVVLT